MMLQRFYKSSFYLMALSFLFLSVSCSHTQRKVAKLDELEQFDESTATSLKVDSLKAEDKSDSKEEEAKAPSAGPVSQNDFAVPEDGALANPEAQQPRAESDFAVPAPEQNSQPEAAPKSEDSATQAPIEQVVQNDLDSIEEAPEAPAVVAEAPKPSQAPAAVVAEAPKAPEASAVVAEAAKLSQAPAAVVAEAQKAPTPEALAADAMDAEENKEVEMASANISSLIEKNLLWIAFAIVGGVIVAFLNIRRNRRSGTHT